MTPRERRICVSKPGSEIGRAYNGRGKGGAGKMSGGNTIRRRTPFQGATLISGYVKTKEEYESQNVKYMGSVGAAAKQGYFTIAACERNGVPCRRMSFQNIRYFAMLADCYVDQCITDETGSKRRPCIPVFYREQEESK